MIPKPSELATQAQTKLQTLVTLTRAGIVHPERPDHVWHTVAALLKFGTTPAAGYIGAAKKFPNEPAIIDELGTLTFKQVDERTNALAHAFARDGIGEGDGVAIMCRNHRGWIDAVVACSKLGANALFMNTAFSGPQLTDVAKREKPKAIVYDQEFAEVLADAGKRRKRYVAWHDGKADDPLLEDLIGRGDPAPLKAPGERGRAIILTSGTTGTPKGASRSMPKSIDPIASLLSRDPAEGAREDDARRAALPRVGLRAVGARASAWPPPSCSSASSTRRATLSLTAQHGCQALVVVPVMIQRILELPDEVLDRYDLSAVKAVPVSGSALPGARLQPLDGPLRREPLQPLRLDRGGVGDDRHAARPARGAGHGGPAAARSVVKIYGEDGNAAAAGRDGPDLRRQRRPVRGLHGRRQQGRDRRAALLGRRRALRCQRAPVHRRPRRRHDRQRRRERLPGRGRGPAARPRERSSRRRCSASTTTSTASGSRP